MKPSRLIPTDAQLERWAWLALVDDAVVARFLAKVEERAAPDFLRTEDGPCSIWTGAQSKGGDPEYRLAYGSFWVGKGHAVRAHIFSALVLGSHQGIRHRKGWHVDHRCKVTLCVAPLHLEPCPAAENQARRWYQR